MWDGEQRVDRLLIDFMGCEDSEYIRTIIRKTLVAAVARVFQPGIKFDYILTLIGPEGLGKSTLFARLGRGWFSDSFDFGMIGKLAASEQVQGVWIIEVGEMKGLRKTEVESVKAFVSKQTEPFPGSPTGITRTNSPGKVFLWALATICNFLLA